MRYYLGLSFLLLFSCGTKEEPKETGNFGSLVFANLDADDTVTSPVTLSSVTTCSHDSDTDLFIASFTGGGVAGALDLRIKGMDKEDATYTCGQEADNKTKGSVGGKFSICSVAVKTAQTNGNANGYAIYRELATEPDLDYAGACQVAITYEASVVSGTVSCTKMVQTLIDSLARNPYSSAVTLDLASTSKFECSLR